MSEHTNTRRGRLGRALERLLIAFVCLEPRLMAAYQIALAEVAGHEGDQERRPAADDGNGSITNRRHAAAGVAA